MSDVLDYKNICEKKVKESENFAREEHQAAIKEKKNKISSLQINSRGNILKNLFLGIRLFFMNRSLKRLEKRADKIIKGKIIFKAKEFYQSKIVFEKYQNLLIGAKGEEKALNELKKLPDTYSVINNLELSFYKPIYNRETDQRIYSIQADHIVVGPTGVFLIETKHWSKVTVNNPTGFSPFDQVRRTSYALFCYLNPRKRGFFFWFKKQKKISIKSILLMTNVSTQERERFVKVLDVSQLNGYITWFPIILSDGEVDKVVRNLLVERI